MTFRVPETTPVWFGPRLMQAVPPDVVADSLH
jgi:hypothetical protein